MIVPQSLKPGDKIGIAATARKIRRNEIERCIEILKSWGLEVVVGASVGAQNFQFAGDDDFRRNDLQQMVDDESIRAVLFARGGYGTVRIIDDLDWRKFLKRPKWLCGFSDITVIQSHLLSVYEVATIHSVMAFNFQSATEGSTESLREILFGEKIKYLIGADPLNRNGVADGVLCGGNLSLICSLNGTPSDISADDKMLLIEDIDEHLYHVDRMMLNLKRSGKLENLAALIVGHFSEMKNKDENNPFGKSAYEIIAEHVSEYDYPVCYNFPVGHEPDNMALAIGMDWELEVSDEVRLSMI